MRRNRFIMAFALLLIICVAFAWKAATRSQRIEIPLRYPSAYARKLLGDRAVAILQGATRVDVFRIDPTLLPPKSGVRERKTIGNYEVLSEGRPNGKAFAARLASVLFSQPINNMAASCFGPNLALQSWKGRESVIVLVCFHCNNVAIYTTHPTGKLAPTTGSGGIHSFWFSRPEMVELAKEAFPDDLEIQQLQDHFE